MSSAAAQLRRHSFLAPEVIQTSMMDCGPASLKCLLEGFGIGVSYGRLREACQTDVDGTSIDVMEEVAVELGLAAEQIMVPVDHLLLPESGVLPAIVVVRLPHGQVHFVVVWRRHGRLLQVMDPGVGRRWMSIEAFAGELYAHQTAVPVEGWREWASSDAFLSPLQRRIRALGVRPATATQLTDEAVAAPGWHRLAALDAATRMIESVAKAGGIDRGEPVGELLRRLSHASSTDGTIPESYWSALPEKAASNAEEDEQLKMRGAVLVSVRGRLPAGETGDPEVPRPRSPELLLALQERPVSPWRELLRVVRENGLAEPMAVLGGAVVAAAGVLIEALLLRALLDLGYLLGIAPQRLGSLGVLLIFLAAMILINVPIAAGIQRVGRKLEIGLRLRFLVKIPRIADRYFHSRLLSDMAERCHSIPALRRVTTLVYELWNSFFQLLFTIAGLVWIEPRTGPAALVVALSAGAMALISQRVLNERDLRVRGHGAALSRFYLDALMGLFAIRAHGAERSVAREHESVLVQWTDSQLRLQRAAIVVEGIQAMLSLAFSVWLVFGHVARTTEGGSILLFAYWSLQLPALGQMFGVTARQAPALRNVMLRLLEPLDAPEETHGDPASAESPPAPLASLGADPFAPASAVSPAPSRPAPSRPPSSATAPADRAHLDTISRFDSAPPSTTMRGRGVHIEMKDVTVQAGGHTLLQGIDVDIEASGHVAVVGASGAGKSTLVGLLLGWHRAATGMVAIDGEPLGRDRLGRLRRETAWVDPAVMLYNRGFLDNLTYGAPSSSPHELGWVIDAGDLREVIERLPDGLQTTLGEAGALVSGGEGQRIRFGRAMLRADARLVLLDEPFRGLDRERRRVMLQRARELWKTATLLCVTHDVGETQSFPRVLVIDQGRVVEDGDPNFLSMDPSSVYSGLLAAEKKVREGLWDNAMWRRIKVERGRVVEGTQIKMATGLVTDPVVDFSSRAGLRRGGGGEP